MQSHFVKRLNAYLDLEAHGSEFADWALEMGYAHLSDEKNTSVFLRDQVEIQAGEQEGYSSLRDKALPNAKATQFESRGNDRLSGIRTSDGDLKDTTATRFVDWFYRKDNLHKALEDDESLTFEEALAKRREEHEEQRISELRGPDLHRLLLRKFANQLDEMVGGVERLDVLPVNWSSVPPQLKTLLTEAHECWLLGQELSTAVLCGASLEEGLKLLLGRDSFWKLTEGIRLATPLYFDDPSPTLTAAHAVCKARNDAVHDPKKYLSTMHKSKVSTLHNARFVIGQLFAEGGEKTCRL